MVNDNRDFIEHVRKEAQTKKIKKPWLGALLALIFGPIGLIYYSWKAAIGWFILLAVGVFLLNIIFPDFQFPSWSKYIVLPVIASYTYFDIKWWNSAITYWKDEK
ncbi:MAG TPA: hypothetical protein PLE40_00400 [Candidatus Pacearchaeota archaeon]|nr:hypothetical protein [Candidatus Pacearchaeota archaeon]